MSTPSHTPEDQLVVDIVSKWATTPPTTGWPLVHFHTQGDAPLPVVIVGHEGAEREKAKGMTGTARVRLKIAIVSDLDVTAPATHQSAVAAMESALLGLAATDLSYTWLHALLREPPALGVDDGRQKTVLAYTAIVTQKA